MNAVVDKVLKGRVSQRRRCDARAINLDAVLRYAPLKAVSAACETHPIANLVTRIVRFGSPLSARSDGESRHVR